MTSQPLYLNLIWHMHQPYYKDLVTKEYVLPWVRLHGIKDYYEMVAILDRYPNVKATFNMVPSLLSQVEEYVSGEAKDRNLLLSEKDPADLSEEEVVYMLKNFFMCNWEVMIKPYQRFYDLLLKRGRFATQSELSRMAHRFSQQELIDLQVWANLCWFGFNARRNDPVISDLIKKGKYFNAEDKKLLFEKEKEILSAIIPKHKELSDRKQIELTTSPFYHPILPLLCDTNSAKEAMPYMQSPSMRFQHPEDAKYQIEKAIAYHEQKFGEKPRGMWPSEGSVSDQMMSLVAEAGIRWVATDEGILSASLGLSRLPHPSELCKPYLAQGKVAMVFRNHFLSDQIGFVYQRWRAKDAVGDFMKHLHNIRASLPNDGRKYLLSVILDGENAWEFYKDGGEEFLNEFYKTLGSDSNIQTVRPGDFMEENPPGDHLPRVFAGSWINTNFRIWIGHEEDNLAWDYLSRARILLDGSSNAMAWQELYVAEGSDWCWWYGDDHSSDNDETFDALYRKHLKNIYHLLDKEAPKYLDKPIKSVKKFRPTREPVYLIQPEIDGVVTNYYEWLSAGYFDIEKSKGAMHQIETILMAFYYGFSRSDLYIRLDCHSDFMDDECKKFSFSLITYLPDEYKLELKHQGEQPVCTLYKLDEKENWQEVKKLSTFAIKKIIELSLPFADISAKTGDEIQFCIAVEKEGNEIERWPRGGVISIKVPTATYEMEQWSV